VDLQTVGKFTILLGVSLAIVGGMLWGAGKMGLGGLPGDLRFSGQGWGCFVPITTSILLSLLLTLVLNLLLRGMGK
jgi:hypothetical protein